MKRNFYMHTIDDQPASFDGVDYIYFATGNTPVVLAKSLRQIRREQQKDIARTRRDYDLDVLKKSIERQGYVLVRLPS